MVLLGVIAALYLLGMPLATWGVCRLHKKLFIDRVAARAPRNKPPSLPDPLWPKVKELMKFSLKDTRPVTLGKKTVDGLPVRVLLLLLWVAGLVFFLLAPLTGKWLSLPLGLLLYGGFIGYGMKSAHPVITTRKTAMKRMFEIALSKGLVPKGITTPQEEVTVLEWNDLTKPQKVEFKVSDTFSDDGQEGFQKQFNQIFGMETTWVPSDDPETGASGWDYDKGQVTLYAVPPLPRLAPWEARYVLDPAVAWSFFPLALGVENGIELVNPETGEKENVLGFDVSGEQDKYSKKAGIKQAGKITTSPMALVAGGTGGGKSLAVETKVEVLDLPTD